MEELTIEEIVFLWSVKYKYDHVLHGFTFEDKEDVESKVAERKELKSLYGDLI